MTKLTVMSLVILALAVAGPSFAQGSKAPDVPKFASLPPGTIGDTALSRLQRLALTELGKQDPELRRKIEGKLTGTSSLRDRYVYLTRQLASINRRIDIVERSYKKGFANKDQLKLSLNIGKVVRSLQINAETDYEDYLMLEIMNSVDPKERLEFQRQFHDFFERAEKYRAAYRAFRADRRKGLGLHKKVGMTEPPKKKADDKPKTPANGDDKKACSGGGMMGTMNCVETLIEQEG